MVDLFEENRANSKSKPGPSRRRIVIGGAIIALVVAVISVAAILYFTQSDEPTNDVDSVPEVQSRFNEDGSLRSDYTISPEERHAINHNRRIDGEVVSISDEVMQLRLLGETAKAVGSDVLELKLRRGTDYMKLASYQKATKSDVAPGSQALVTYDTSDNSLLSIWVDYEG